MLGAFDYSDLSDLESKLDISRREFEPNNFIGLIDLSKKSQPSLVSLTPTNESQTNKEHWKPICFSKEYENYFGKERELDTFHILQYAYSIQNLFDDPTIY
jgi:hypothetical protein